MKEKYSAKKSKYMFPKLHKMYSVYLKIVRWILIVIPFLIFWVLLLALAIDLVTNKVTTKLFALYQAIIIISISMTAVTFTYAKSVEGNKRKYPILIYCGERLMQSTIFSLIAFIFIYAEKDFIYRYFDCTHIICSWIGRFLRVIAIALLMNAVHQIDFSIKKILKIAQLDIEKYDYDDITQNWR